MPIDLPPQPVEYRIEAPAPAISSQTAAISKAISASRNGLSRPVISIPAIDHKNPSLSAADRSAARNEEAMLKSGNVSISNGIPDSYIGTRLKLAIAQSRLVEDMKAGEASPQMALQIRCRAVAVVMDQRAGKFVVGGEAAAQKARLSIDPKIIQQCKAAVEKAARYNQGEGKCTSPGTETRIQSSRIAFLATQNRFGK